MNSRNLLFIFCFCTGIAFPAYLLWFAYQFIDDPHAEHRSVAQATCVLAAVFFLYSLYLLYSKFKTKNEDR
jgi:FtsH-binding integral membrane protein